MCNTYYWTIYNIHVYKTGFIFLLQNPDLYNNYQESRPHNLIRIVKKNSVSFWKNTRIVKNKIPLSPLALKSFGLGSFLRGCWIYFKTTVDSPWRSNILRRKEKTYNNDKPLVVWLDDSCLYAMPEFNNQRPYPSACPFFYWNLSRWPTAHDS